MDERSEFDGVDREVLGVFLEELGEHLDALRGAREPKEVLAVLETCGRSSGLLALWTLAGCADRAAAVVAGSATLGPDAVAAIRVFTEDAETLAREGRSTVPARHPQRPPDAVPVRAEPRPGVTPRVAKPWWRLW